MKLHVTVPWMCVNGESREWIILEPGIYDLERKVIQPPPPGSPPKKVWLVVAGTSNGMAESAFREYVLDAAPSVWIEEKEEERFQFFRANVHLSQSPRIYAAKYSHFPGEYCIELFPQTLPTLDNFKTASAAHDWLIACFGKNQHLAWFPTFYQKESQMSDEVRLKELRPGAVFVTRDGTYAVKSQYCYDNVPGSQCLCVLLETGEYAHFPDGNLTFVREVMVDGFSSDEHFRSSNT
jgi:hypothetical protein